MTKPPPLDSLVSLLLARVATGEHIAIIRGEIAGGDFIVVIESARPRPKPPPQQLEFDFSKPAKKPRARSSSKR